MNKISTSLLLLLLMGASSVPQNRARIQIGPENVESRDRQIDTVHKEPVESHSVRVASEPEHIQLAIPRMYRDQTVVPSVGASSNTDGIKVIIPEMDRDHASPLLRLASKVENIDSIAQQTDTVHNGKVNLPSEEKFNTGAAESTLERGTHVNLPLVPPPVGEGPRSEHVRLTITGMNKDHASPLVELSSKAGYFDSIAQQTDKVHNDNIYLPSEVQFTNTGVAESTFERGTHVNLPLVPPPVGEGPRSEHVRSTITGMNKDHASPLVGLAPKAGYLGPIAPQTDKVHNDNIYLPSEVQFTNTGVAESTLKRGDHFDPPALPSVKVASEAEYIL